MPKPKRTYRKPPPVPAVASTLINLQTVTRVTVTPEQLVQELMEELGSAQAVHLVDLLAARCLAASSRQPALDSEEFIQQLVKLVQQPVAETSTSTVDEILMTFSTHYHFIQLFQKRSHFVHLLAHKDEISLAIAREIIRTRLARLDQLF